MPSKPTLLSPSSRTAQNNLRSSVLYEKLRLAIVSGELRPNEPLIEDDLSERLGVSRTPLRESFQWLAADGLLVRRRRGWAVREFTRDEIRENFEVRASLEGTAARLASERGTAEDLVAIKRIHEQRLALQYPNNDVRVSTNRDFHAAIIKAAGNERLNHMIFMAGNFYLTRRVASLTNDVQYQRAQQEHSVITAAIQARDATTAETAMRTHIMHSFETWLALAGD